MDNDIIIPISDEDQEDVLKRELSIPEVASVTDRELEIPEESNVLDRELSITTESNVLDRELSFGEEVADVNKIDNSEESLLPEEYSWESLLLSPLQAFGLANARGITHSIKNIAIQAKELDDSEWWFPNFGIRSYEGKSVEELATWRAGQAIENFYIKQIGEPENQSILTDLAGMLGQITNLAIQSRINRGLAIWSAYSQGAVSGYEEAKQFGASDKVAQDAAINYGFIGISDVLLPLKWAKKVGPLGKKYMTGLYDSMLGKLDKVPFNKIINPKTGQYIKAYLFEATQEGAQTYGENMVAAAKFDAAREYTDHVLYNAALGGFGGAYGHALFAGTRQRSLEAQQTMTLVETLDNLQHNMSTLTAEDIKSTQDAQTLIYAKLTEGGMSENAALDVLGMMELFADRNSVDLAEVATSFNIKETTDKAMMEDFTSKGELEPEVRKAMNDLGLQDNALTAYAYVQIKNSKIVQEWRNSIANPAQYSDAGRKELDKAIRKAIVRAKTKVVSEYQYGLNKPKGLTGRVLSSIMPKFTVAMNKASKGVEISMQKDAKPIEFVRAMGAVMWANMDATTQQRFVKALKIRTNKKGEYKTNIAVRKFTESLTLFIAKNGKKGTRDFVGPMKNSSHSNLFSDLGIRMRQHLSSVEGFNEDITVDKQITKALDTNVKGLIKELFTLDYNVGSVVKVTDTSISNDLKINTGHMSGLGTVTDIINNPDGTVSYEVEFDENVEVKTKARTLAGQVIKEEGKTKWNIKRGRKHVLPAEALDITHQGMFRPEILYKQLKHHNRTLPEFVIKYLTDITFDAYDNSPLMQEVSFDINRTQQMMQSEINKMEEFIGQLKQSFSFFERNLTKRGEFKSVREAYEQYLKMSENEKENARQRDRRFEIAHQLHLKFTEFRKGIINYRIKDHIDSLPGALSEAVIEYMETRNINAVEKVFNEDGTVDMSEVADEDITTEEENYFIADLARAYNVQLKALEQAIGKVHRIKKFGDENYIPQFELGEYIATIDGTPVAFATTQYGLKKKIEKLDRTRLDQQFGLKRSKPVKIITPFDEAFDNTINAFAQKKGILAGEDNIFKSLRAYNYFVLKQHFLNPQMNLIEKTVKDNRMSFPKVYQEKFLKVIEDVRSQKRGLFDRVTDRVISKQFGLPTRLATKFFGSVVRPAFAASKLGYKTSSMLVNGIQGFINLHSQFSLTQVQDGLKLLKSEEGQKLIKENAHLLGLGFITEHNFDDSFSQASSAYYVDKKGKIRNNISKLNPLWIFQIPERHLREIMFASAYQQSLNVEKNPEHIAIRDASMTTWLAAFTYNTANMPQFLRSAEGRTLFQFKSYLPKQLEYMSTLDKKQFSKYMGMTLFFGGPRMLIRTIKSLPLMSVVFGSMFNDLEELGKNLYDTLFNEWFGRMYYGVAGIFGIDIGTNLAYDFPQEQRDFFGPSGSFVLEALAGFHDMYKYDLSAGVAFEKFRRRVNVGFSSGTDTDTIIKQGWDIDLPLEVTMFKYLDELLNLDANGNVLDQHTGEIKYRVPMQYDIDVLNLMEPGLRALGGFSSIERSESIDLRSALYRLSEKEKQRKWKIIRSLEYHINKNTEIPWTLLRDATNMGINLGTTIERWAERKTLTPQQRLDLRANMINSIYRLEDYEDLQRKFGKKKK
jgi:hypothetical protein